MVSWAAMTRLGRRLVLGAALLALGSSCAQPEARRTTAPGPAAARAAAASSAAVGPSTGSAAASSPSTGSASSALASAAGETAPPASNAVPGDGAPAPALPPLFRRYPKLGQALPYVALGKWPTPVERADSLGQSLGIAQLYLKRDDLGGAPYGGNKVRKLELVLAEAKARGKQAVITFGGVGSNHALATALYARKVGLHAVLWLPPEPPSAHVRHNLLVELASGAEIHLTSNDHIDALVRENEHGQDRPQAPFVIPPGGSSLLGNVGLVNAAFELADQIAAGQLPPPDVVYVATGTLGSAVGLAIGLHAAGLHTRVRAVRASSTKYVNEQRMQAMVEDTVKLLRARDPSFPAVELGPTDLTIENGYVGRGYALPTAKGAHAMELVRERSGLELDPTYTAKTFAALIDDAPRLRAEVVLFWQTYDPRPIEPAEPAAPDVPRELRGYLAFTAREAGGATPRPTGSAH
jgi:D-cysteine desulfhydrase